MLATSNVLNVVTLLLNGNIFNNFSNRELNSIKHSNTFIRGTSESGLAFEPTASDEIFEKSAFFPKCCPPSYLYDPETRDCAVNETATPIYDELNITLDAVKTNLHECQVIVDRFVPKQNLTRLQGNGSLVAQNEIYHSGEFCLDKTSSDRDVYVIRLCRNKDYCFDDNGTSIRDWCIHKCCRDGFSNTRRTCVYGYKYGLDVESNKKYYDGEIADYTLFYRQPQKCQGVVYELREQKFTIKRDGTLWTEEMKYNITEYCLDTFYNNGLMQSTSIVHICGNEHFPLKLLAMKIAVTLSCVSYVAILALYILLYRINRLVEKIINCFCATSLVFWIMYAMGVYTVEIGGFCLAFGYIHFFLVLSRLFWMSVLTYEIWYTMGSVNENIRQTESTLRRKMKFCYFYATITPAFLTILFILAHQGVLALSEQFVPQLDIFYCWIDVRALDHNYGYLYIYVPTTVLIITITVYYGMIVWYFVHRTTQLKTANLVYTVNDNLLKTNRRKFVIIVRLGLAIATTWVCYSYSYMRYFGYSSITNNAVFVFSFIYTFEGIIFFFIFCVEWD